MVEIGGKGDEWLGWMIEGVGADVVGNNGIGGGIGRGREVFIGIPIPDDGIEDIL